MRIVFINSVSFGSTGNIIKNLASEFSNFHDVYFCFPRSRSNSIFKTKLYKLFKFGNLISRNIDRFLSYSFGVFGVYSILPTIRLIIFLIKINPQIVHLHNLHGNYLNYPLLFTFLNKKKAIKVVWTFHDTWPFTGHCSHYSAVDCSKFINGCFKCPIHNKNYPKSLKDNSRFNYSLKRKFFTKIRNLTIITPSKWLQKEVEKSFLLNKKIVVIPNGVDKNLFSKKLSIPSNNNKKINLLFVSNVWNKNKGIDIIHDLVELLDRTVYTFNIVGVVVSKVLQSNINYLGLIKNEYLSKLYNENDLFINPSIEETFSLVTAEAICCGIPVIVSNKTALPELIRDKNGKIVLFNNAKSYANIINHFNKSDFNHSSDHIITRSEMSSLYLTEYLNE